MQPMQLFRSFLIFIFSAMMALSVGLKHCDEVLDMSVKKAIESVQDTAEENPISTAQQQFRLQQQKVTQKQSCAPAQKERLVFLPSTLFAKNTPSLLHRTQRFLHIFHLF
ncbi:hypothetical protein [Flavobacterium sp.]|uniref:hypothetical protein n=1 Tax=Flavobacterium sp. TaxID=239 RepID=UPI00333F4CE8